MIFFRPNFCANCGEKIERTDWTLWSSRRFCDVCATEFIAHEYTPRIIVGIAFLAIVSFAGSFFSNPGKDDTASAKRLVPPKTSLQAATAAVPQMSAPGNANSTAREITQETEVPKTLVPLSQLKPTSVEKTGATETAYFCGAETKKGTACSRRVKGNNRCYQHVGMPSMSTAAKLKIG